MSQRKFNPSEPHDTVHGFDELNRKYFQNGEYFNHQGIGVSEPTETKPSKKSKADK